MLGADIVPYGYNNTKTIPADSCKWDVWKLAKKHMQLALILAPFNAKNEPAHEIMVLIT